MNRFTGAWILVDGNRHCEYDGSVLTTLEDVIERIVTGYAPDRIILFGSHASGEARDGSDFDLLLVGIAGARTQVLSTLRSPASCSSGAHE